MTYLNYLKDEIVYRYLGYLFGAVIFGLSLYFSKVVNASFLNAFLSGCSLAIGTIVLTAYIKYRRGKK